jgi:hypothetical protein
MEFGLGVFVGALLASAGWWFKVRGLNAALSDLKNGVDAVKKL